MPGRRHCPARHEAITEHRHAAINSTTCLRHIMMWTITMDSETSR